MIRLGCDIGAIVTKTVILNDRSILAYDITPNRGKLTQAIEDSVTTVLSKAGVGLDGIAYCGGTGWGEKYLPFSHSKESVINCLAKGTHWMLPSARTLVDIGGLSSIAIGVNEKGKVLEYRASDRCAAGTGFFLELAAQALELRVEDLGPISLSAKGKVHISSQCAVFRESEIVTHVNEGVEAADIAAGISHSLALSVATMVKRLGIRREVVVTGGVAKNECVVSTLEQNLGVEATRIPVDSQLVCAIGAALSAS